MAFEDIECVKPAAASATKIPDDGVAVTARKMGNRNGAETRYIRIAIGAKLAKAISLTQPDHRLRLLFGTGSDAGHIQVSVDNAAGKFVAKRSKKGEYALTVNAATAEGLFALAFPAFARSRIEAIRPENGKPPHFVFKASDEMLAWED